jgi:hypothetical protein
MIDETFDYPEYLAIKQAIDNRSLAQNVWQTMATWLQQNTRKPDFRILEIGAGTGSMIIRLLDAGLLNHCQYFAVELEPDFARVAEHELALWAGDNGYSMKAKGPYEWALEKHDKFIKISWITDDILNLTSCFDDGYFDLMIGHAVVDLLPVPECLPGLLKLVKPEGGYYFSLNFAGVTSFAPPHPRDLEITAAYHRDMDSRFPGLDWRASQTGQELGRWLEEQGHPVLADGDSNWLLSSVSEPQAVENRFIENILATMEKALAGKEGLADWLALRRQQADAGELSFFAANRDYFGRTCVTDAAQGIEPD